MTKTYRDIPDGEIDGGSPVTEQMLIAFRDNPIALLQGAAGAPINHFAWHPFDAVLNGDGATGLYYDFAVSGGSRVNSPLFEDGYEYRFCVRGISQTGSTNFLARVVYSAGGDSSWLDVGFSSTGFIDFVRPFSFGRVEANKTTLLNTFEVASAQLDFAPGGVSDPSGGKVYLFRRRAY